MGRISISFVVVAASCACSAGEPHRLGEVSTTTVTVVSASAFDRDKQPWPQSAEPLVVSDLGETTEYEPQVESHPEQAGAAPNGVAPEDVAARVALAAFGPSGWELGVAADLDPSFATTLEIARLDSAAPTAAAPQLLLVAVDRIESPGAASERFFVSFDEVSREGMLTRHVTSIDVKVSAGRALVTAMVALA